MSPGFERRRPPSSRRRLARRPPTFFVVGAGRVGVGLALALRACGWRLAGVWNRGAAGRRRARRLLGPAAGPAGSPGRRGLPAGIATADLVLVAVSDGAVGEVGRMLCDAPLRRGGVVAHTSGALGADALGLGDARLRGVHAGSIHPLVACADPVQAARSLAGASFALEGDAAARRLLRRLVAALGGRALAIRPEDKPRYHAALVMASNLVVALVHVATLEAAAAGVGDAGAVAALTAGAVDLVRAKGSRDALTGPVARGDARTVSRHLAALAGVPRRVYRLLSRVALDLARERGLPDDAARRLATVLGEVSAAGSSRGGRRRPPAASR